MSKLLGKNHKLMRLAVLLALGGAAFTWLNGQDIKRYVRMRSM